MTRIIAGSAKGRRLSIPPDGTRPTSDRVREALFSALDTEWSAQSTSWERVCVLDLYAGSGALGLEALSRGASEVVLVESSRTAVPVLEANVARVGLPGATVLRRDVERLPAQEARGRPADLVLADPPYGQQASRVADVLEALVAAGWIASGATAVVERPARDRSTPFPASWEEPRMRTYGDTALWYGRVPPVPTGEPERPDPSTGRH